VDEYGDHCLGCVANHKTKASNSIRDGISKVFQQILLTARLIDSPTQVEKETNNVIHTLPCLKPFDLTICLDHSLDAGAWRTPYTRIGFDVTLIHSNKPSFSTNSEAAQFTEMDLRLQDGDKMKFARRSGGTNSLMNHTLSADGVIGEIIDKNNNCYISIAVGPYSELSSLFRRFLSGDKVIPIPAFDPDRPHAQRAYKTAKHVQTPYDVHGKADKNWKHDNGNSLFGFSYLAPSPSAWAEQRISLGCQTTTSNLHPRE
jgi:hypothetical protein